MSDTTAPTAPQELRGRVGSCVEHGAAAEFYDDGSGQCLYCCQVETSCNCTEARSTPAEALDVERLQQIMHPSGCTVSGCHATEWERIAAEYARLRSPESDR